MSIRARDAPDAEHMLRDAREMLRSLNNKLHKKKIVRRFEKSRYREQHREMGVYISNTENVKSPTILKKKLKFPSAFQYSCRIYLILN
jgi:hypothetical protein